MSYRTEHALWEYIVAASLRVNHEFCLRCQRRSKSEKKTILASTREIDLCASLSSFFGASSHLAAQGTADPDVKNDAPVFRVEVKYPFPKKTNWAQVKKDWDWLIACSNPGKQFQKRALVLFWPSTSLYKLTNCISVPRGHDSQYSQLDYAPLVPYAEPEMPPNGSNQRLRFKVPTNRSAMGLQLPGGKRVRVDLVGRTTHPIWCAIYTRLTPTEYSALSTSSQRALDDTPIVT